MADDNGRDENEGSETPSIFDLFEPPPEADPSTFGKVPVVRGDDDEFDRKSGTTAAERKTAAEAEAAGLQHWTEPATGQVPAVLASEKPNGELWGDVEGPSWQSDDPSWSGPDLADVFAGSESAELDEPSPSSPRPESDDRAPEVRPSPPRIDTSEGRRIPGTEPTTGLDHTEIANHGHDFDPASATIGRPSDAPHTPSPATDAIESAERVRARAEAAVARSTSPRPGRTVSSPPPVSPDPAEVRANRHSSKLQMTAAGDDQNPAAEPPSRPESRHSRPLLDDVPTAPGLYPSNDAADSYFDGEESLDHVAEAERAGGRNLPQAIGTGVILAALVLGALWIGPEAMMVIVAAAALLAIIELFNAMRMAGLRPATLLGLLGAVATPVAAYFRGDAAFTVVVAMSVVFGVLWYLAGADDERPVLNLSLTIFGVLWIGGLGAFAALILRSEEVGVQLLLSTIVLAVVSDTMAFFGGRAFGRRPFHSASPNKTWEGTLTGFCFAIIAAFAMAVMPFSTMWDGRFLGALALGLVVGILTPVGDLAESLVKRDLGVKDMGTLVPGHGGILDRIDGLLFALPGAYFVALTYGIF